MISNLWILDPVSGEAIPLESARIVDVDLLDQLRDEPADLTSSSQVAELAATFGVPVAAPVITTQHYRQKLMELED